jgi:hypothetical protein
LNPAKFWVRCEAPIKEEVGIMMISIGNWSIQRKKLPQYHCVHECCIRYLWTEPGKMSASKSCDLWHICLVMLKV